MKVIEYDQIRSGDFKIVIRTSSARHVTPTVNTIPRPSSEVDDEDQTGDEDDIKSENDVSRELTSESGVALSVAEPEEGSDPYPVSEDGEVPSVSGWNRLFFGKEDPREIEKKGFRLEIMVHEDTIRYFCGPRVLRPAVGSVLEASDYGWDSVALGIVVSAIHGQYEHVPVEIDPELFVEIAVIADYMKCGEALSMASRVWLSNIDEPKAGEGRESAVLMWFYVSWVFPLDDLFVFMAGLVVMRYQGPETVELNGLPLQGFIEKLDKLRQGNINRLLNKMNELGSLLLVEEGCPHAKNVQCSMMTLGYLKRLRHKFRHSEPPVVFPYPGYSIQDVCSMIENFSEQGIRDEAHGHDQEQAEHPCTVKGRMLKEIQSLKEDIDDVCWDYAELWGYPGRIWDADSE